MDPYVELRDAIILLAVKDWRSAMSRLRKNPNSLSAQHTRSDTERFFLSQWFGVLTQINGEELLRRLKEELSE